jgi:hypothetical protein
MTSYPQVIKRSSKVIEVRRTTSMARAPMAETGSRRNRVDEIRLSEWGDGELSSRSAGLRTIAGRFGEDERSEGMAGRGEVPSAERSLQEFP